MNKQTEYLVLNNQILEYERYAFERTLLIGFIGFPCLGIIDNGFYYWIPFFIMLLLIFNLSYTIGNLEKAIDLKVYLQKVLETDKSYISWAKFLILRENYITNNKKIVNEIFIKEEYSEGVTIEERQFKLIKTMTIIFLILYLVIVIIFMNSQSSTTGYGQKLLPIVLAGGLLGIATFVIGIIQVFIVGDINIVAEKIITENTLNEMKQVKS